MRVLSERGDFDAHPPATDDPSEIGPVDFVFLGLKANSYASSGPLLEPLLHDETAVVAGQNGIPWWYFHGLDGEYGGAPHRSRRPGGAVTKVIPPERAIGCVVYSGTSWRSPASCATSRARASRSASRTARSRRAAGQFSEAMIEGGLKCPVEAQVRDEIWVKLMGNVAFNPLSALTRSTLAAMCGHPPTRRLVAAMMEETLEIAHAVGAQPSVSIERRLAGAERVGEHKPSTLQDLEAGKPLELAALIDAVVELADLTDIDAPCLRAVAAASGLLAETLELT